MSQRSTTIDFWRGLVLVTILINHVPGNLLENLTHRNIGFSDAAEAFVFVSGLALAIIYGPRIARDGPWPTTKRNLSRAFELYRTHLLLTAFAVASFAVVHVLTGHERLLTAHGRGPFFENSPEALVGLLGLSYQIGYFNILPLYVALMLAAPLFFLLARRGPWLMLGVSFAIYLAARIWPMRPPSWPEGAGGWFFDPFTWQLLFALGLAAGLRWRGDAPARSNVLLGASVVVVAASWIVVTEAFGFAPGLRGAVMPHLDLGKNELGLGRIAHFAALAYLLVVLRVAAVVENTPVGAELARIGRHGLPVFVAGSVLSALGQALTIVATESRTDGVGVLAMLFTLASIGLLVLMVRAREWSSPRTSPQKPASEALSAAKSSPSRPASAATAQLVPAPARARAPSRSSRSLPS